MGYNKKGAKKLKEELAGKEGKKSFLDDMSDSLFGDRSKKMKDKAKDAKETSKKRFKRKK